MSKRKVYVSIDGNEYFWIVVENKKIANMNATREDICKISRMSYYNPINICPRCREEKEREGKKITERSILYPGNSRRGKDKESGTEEWVCSRHWGIDYQRYNTGSQNNIKKSLSGSRTGYLDPESKFEGGWYEQYRVKDKEELKNANIIWNKIGEDDEN